MILPPRIALRYLRAPKSHSAVSAISIISVVGVAVATAAIICVLSVFNGFRSLLSERLDSLAPDILITPAKGKTFSDADSLISLIKNVEEVRLAMPSVVDNALAIFNSREMPITIRGVDFAKYQHITSLDSLLIPDSEPLRLNSGNPEELSPAVVSIGTASQLGIGETDLPLLIFAPRREGRVNLANPMASFLTDSISVAGIFQAYQSDYDENTVICDINTARDLFQYTDEATSLEIALSPGADPAAVVSKLSAILGPSAIVRDRLRQQETNFRMISIEKWVTFLLLIFILIVASFNIISTLCMLVLEKQKSLSTLTAIGMRKRSISAIFSWEAVFVTLSGGAIGIILGLTLCLLQQHFGLIRLAGDPSRMVITAYPVLVKPTDILLVLIPLAAITLLTSLTTTAFTRSKLG